MSKLYIDTNIFINIVNDEISKHSNKNMAEPASNLFFEALSCKHILIISSWTIKEILKKVPVENIHIIFEFLKKKIETCKYDDKDVKEAKNKSQTNFADALHIVLAEKTKADFIVTRNISDFLKIGTKIPIKKPELL